MGLIHLGGFNSTVNKQTKILAMRKFPKCYIGCFCLCKYPCLPLLSDAVAQILIPWSFWDVIQQMACQVETVAFTVNLAPLGMGFNPKERQELLWRKCFYPCLTSGKANRWISVAITQSWTEYAFLQLKS